MTAVRKPFLTSGLIAITNGPLKQLHNETHHKYGRVKRLLGKTFWRSKITHVAAIRIINVPPIKWNYDK